MILREFCAENFVLVKEAITKGAQRIELCDNLVVGGTTPSVGVLEATLEAAHEEDISVMCMIRPRGGNFVYTDIELKIMERDILEANRLGADGIVFGALTSESWLDEEGIERLFVAAGGMQMTFHMAFDEIREERQFEAVDWLAERSFTRILTHGGSLKAPIENHFEKLKRLVDDAQGKISILVGGGVTYQNFEEVVQQTGAKEVHGTKIVPL